MPTVRCSGCSMTTPDKRTPPRAAPPMLCGRSDCAQGAQYPRISSRPEPPHDAVITCTLDERLHQWSVYAPSITSRSNSVGGRSKIATAADQASGGGSRGFEILCTLSTLISIQQKHGCIYYTSYHLKEKMKKDQRKSLIV